MEWDGTPYHSLNWEIRKQFGKKLYKISLDGRHDLSEPGRNCGIRRLYLLQ